MKTKSVLLFVIGWLLALSSGRAQTIVAPAIVAAPSSQTAQYGSNVVFTVVATGTPLNYQWCKNGVALADYGNVAGANTATLNLVGVAQDDAASYAVVISNGGGTVTSAVATLTVNPLVVFTDDFESGLSNWTTFPDTTALTNSTLQDHTVGGSSSALLTSSQGKMYHNLGRKLAGRVRATFFMYDDGNQTRYFGELRGYTGQGQQTYVAPGGLRQTFAIGSYNVPFPTSNTGTLVGETLDATKYQGRVARGKNTGWFNLSAAGAPNRSPGWHKFVIDRAANGDVDFYVDDVLGRTITGGNYVFLDCVSIGSFGGGTITGNTWFDDVKVEAFPRTFDYQTLASSGALPDLMRLRDLGTNASLSTITQTNTVFETNGAAVGNMAGRWTTDGLGISSGDARGSATFTVNIPADGAYRVEVEGQQRNDQRTIAEAPVAVWLDGESLGRHGLPRGSATNALIHYFTPFIKSGAHNITVYWDNADPHRSFFLQAVRVQSLVGSHWIRHRLRTQSSLDVVPPLSAVSPVCIEGRSQYLSMMTVSAGTAYPLSPVSIAHGAGHRWYANVPLSPESVTRIEVSYQNGGLTETNEIAWQVSNLLEANNMTIRRGDSLLLTAAPNGASSGTVTITVSGVTNYTTDVATPVPYLFDQAGTFVVTGAYGSDTTASITVKVVDASLGSPVAAWAGHRRYWDCPQLPPEAVLDCDPRLQLAPASGGKFSLITDAAEPRTILARLGTNGPILASLTVEGFRLFTTADTYLRRIQTYDDGSQLIETALVMSPVVSGVTVGMNVLVSGVTFDDGTVTRTVSATDFDQLGICPVRFVRAPGVKTSVCHTTKAYQDNVLIGWPTPQ